MQYISENIARLLYMKFVAVTYQGDYKVMLTLWLKITINMIT